MSTIDKSYQNPKTGLVGVQAFADRIGKPVKEVRNALESSESYGLNAPSRNRPALTRTVYSTGPLEILGADLMDVRAQDVQANQGTQYLLVCVDIFSSYSWVVPMKDKSASETEKAIESVLQKVPRMPTYFWTDKGKEFYNSKVKHLLDAHSIKHYSTETGNKVPQCENKIRFLRRLMGRYADAHQTMVYMPILQDLVTNMNTSKSRTRDGLTPKQALDRTNHDRVMNALYSYEKPPPPKFKVGDYVRIAKQKSQFSKESTHERWSVEVFKIREVVSIENPCYYYLEDLNGEPVKGPFYTDELQKTVQPKVFRIQEVLKKRGRGKAAQVLVRYVGYGPEFDQWIPASSLEAPNWIYFKSNLIIT